MLFILSVVAMLAAARVGGHPRYGMIREIEKYKGHRETKLTLGSSRSP